MWDIQHMIAEVTALSQKKQKKVPGMHLSWKGKAWASIPTNHKETTTKEQKR